MSTGLVAHLSPDELDAVIVHERYHVAARDPLKLVVARTAARTCFFLPAVGHLVGRYLAGATTVRPRCAISDGFAPDLPPLPVAAVAVSALILMALTGLVVAAALQGGLSAMRDGDAASLSPTETVGAVFGGLVCAAGMALAALGLRRGRSCDASAPSEQAPAEQAPAHR